MGELAHGEKSRTQSLNQSSRLLDVPGTEAFASEQLQKKLEINKRNQLKLRLPFSQR